MECSKCSENGNLIYMIAFYDDDLNCWKAKCPNCGKIEITGFGNY